MFLSKLSAYDAKLPYAYAPGIFTSFALLDANPSCARRLLLHSSAEQSDGCRELRARCEALGVRIEIADAALSRISRKENCHAAIVFEKFESTLSNDDHIILYQPADMGNLGTILRTCLGFSFSNIAIIKPAVDLFHPRAVRASMGALFSMRIQYFDTFQEYRNTFTSQRLYPFMVDGATPLHQVLFDQGPCALVFGNEASGLPSSFAQIGQPVRIVHNHHIDSLNLANAVSIGVYAFATQTNHRRYNQCI